MKLKKDKSIIELLKKIEPENQGWVIIDHWNADLCAIGIGKADEPRRLIYINTYKNKQDRYDYCCEVPAGPEETEYEETDGEDNVDYEKLIRIIQKHLG